MIFEHNNLKNSFSEEQIAFLEENHMIDKLSEYAKQMQLYIAAIRELETKLEILDEEFRVKYDYNPIHHIETRLKTPGSIFGKLKRKDLPITIESIWENLHDIAGIRVVCPYIDDVYWLAEMLTGQDDITLIEKKDYIRTKKSTGYRSLHLVVSIPVYLATGRVDVKAEIQIRTIAMDYWASAEHRIRYKTQGEIPHIVNERLRICSEELEKIELSLQSIAGREKFQRKV